MRCKIYKNETEQFKIILKKAENKETYSVLVCDGEKHEELITENGSPPLLKTGGKCESCPEYQFAENKKQEKFQIRQEKVDILIEYMKPKTFDNYDWRFSNHKEQIELIKDFPFNKEYRKLILIGKTGIGKTHLSMALIQELRKEDFRAKLIHVQRLYKLFKYMNFYESEKQAEDELREIKETHMLVIDDLGLEKQTESWIFNDGFIGLLDGYRGKIVVTSNLNIEGMREVYQDKIMSRLLERALIINLKGKDYRTEKK